MTESGWLACKDPLRMMECLCDRGKALNRKTGLVACAFARRRWRALPGVLRETIELAEVDIDALARPAEALSRGDALERIPGWFRYYVASCPSLARITFDE